MTQFELFSIVLGVITLSFAGFSWLISKYLNNRKEFGEEKDRYYREQVAHQEALQKTKDNLRKEIDIERTKTSAAETSKIVAEIKRLVDEIKKLFADHKSLEMRVGKVENRMGEHFIRCNERERLVLDIKKKQDERLENLNLALTGGRRIADNPTDRLDREN